MKIHGKPGAQQKIADKKKEHAPTSFATQLAQAQALMPHAAIQQPKHAHHPKPAPKLESRSIVATAPKLPELPAAAKESSAQPAAHFTLNDLPQREPARVEAPPPIWAPKELLADDTARLTINPHQVSFINEGQQMSLQIKNGEVSIRAQGELAASLKSSEAELRIALAQEGLKLVDTEATQHQQNDDATSDQRRRERHTEKEDEWT